MLYLMNEALMAVPRSKEKWTKESQNAWNTDCNDDNFPLDEISAKKPGDSLPSPCLRQLVWYGRGRSWQRQICFEDPDKLIGQVTLSHISATHGLLITDNDNWCISAQSRGLAWMIPSCRSRCRTPHAWTGEGISALHSNDPCKLSRSASTWHKKSSFQSI